MSPVKPCTSTAVWPWYRPRYPLAAELNWKRSVKLCYVSARLQCGPGGDTVIVATP
jgi:hypothetical protein